MTPGTIAILEPGQSTPAALTHRRLRFGRFVNSLSGLFLALVVALPASLPGETAPNSTPRVIKSTGKAPAASATPLGAQYGSAGPTITANPQVVTPPGGQENGSTKLGWDAGTGRPNAEVRVSVDGQSPTPVARGGKGYRTVTVEAGKTYRYTLSDAGQELAAVTVTGKPGTAPISKLKIRDPSPAPTGAQYGSNSPSITANPQVVTPPGGQENGSSKLSWYGGSGHANAEVTVSVDGQRPTPVARGGKGFRDVTVEPGKTYRYILSDAGQELAAVTVTGKPRTAPISKLKVRDASPAPSGAQYGSDGPTITASPVTLPGGQPNGFSKLSWYAGTGHANAEVRVSVDGQNPTPVAKGGKGFRDVTVEPGKTYRYILTDAGQELATVTVKAR